MPGHSSNMHFTCINFFLILPSPQSYEVHDIIIILPMKKLRHRAVKYVAEGYTANEQQSQDLRPVSPIHS